MTGTSRAIRYSTVAAVAVVALVAASVSYRHALQVVGQHGETGWQDAVYPLTVDGLINASLMTCSTTPPSPREPLSREPHRRVP
jgi:hypothetical protein